jgi:small subunit ribosomal protein S19e
MIRAIKHKPLYNPWLSKVLFWGICLEQSIQTCSITNRKVQLNKGKEYTMSLINDVNPNELITKTAEELKKNNAMKPPVWAAFCKTGTHKERPPADPDWWYTRSAAILRTTALMGPIGVSKLRTKYGGRKNCGHQPDRFYRASGNIIRKVFQQLEAAKLIQQVKKEVKTKGRIITPQGQSLLDKIAVTILKATPKPKRAAKPAEALIAPAETATAAEEKSKEEKKPKKEKISIQG